MQSIIEIIGLFLLSLWKIYIGYSYFAFKSYSFIIASTIIISAVISSCMLSLFIFKQMQSKAWFIKFKSSKNYHKGVNFYKKYGFYPSLLLAPVLLGIPIFCLVSYTLRINSKHVLLGLIISSFLWGALIYLSFHFWGIRF